MAEVKTIKIDVDTKQAVNAMSAAEGVSKAVVPPLGMLIAVTAEPPPAGIFINGTLLIIGLKSK